MIWTTSSLLVHTLLFALLAVATACGRTDGRYVNTVGLSRRSDIFGAEDILIGGEVWLPGAPSFITLANKRYSTADGSLKLQKVVAQSGFDNLGFWKSKNKIYTPQGYDIQVGFYVKQYAHLPAVIYGQHFYDAVAGASVGDTDAVSTGYPRFYVRDANATCREHELGFLAFGGHMAGDTDKVIGVWNPESVRRIRSGLDSGPLVLFSQTGQAVVVSSFTNMMTGSVQYHSEAGDMTATWGLMGKLSSIPKDFTYEVIVYYSADGINEAMDGWGKAMNSYYNKDPSYKESDFTNNYIGYWTDNGAYYYYKTEKGKTYEQTIIDLKINADQLKIPYRYIEYDSWWYPKGPQDGVTEWTAMKSVFPKGLSYVWKKTGWRVVAHNRWWSDKNVYWKQNKGKYNFITEPHNNKAIPMDQSFWNDLLLNATEWGMITYEQDWMNVQFNAMNVTVGQAGVGDAWLGQMAGAALQAGVTVQYCMATPRQTLHSVTLPTVTQMRVSDDYLYLPDQWKIGVTSMFADAVGTAPFKDNFWTTSHQPGNPYNLTEPAPSLHSLVATLSTGPVAFCDKIGFSDLDLIHRTCNADGLILKPSRPATAINKQLIQAVFGGFTGEVWSTHSLISGLHFGIILGADITTQSLTVGPTEAGFKPLVNEIVIFNRDTPKSVTSYSNKTPIRLSDCPIEKPCVYHTSPILKVGSDTVVILGELNKWVPMSPQRVTSLTLTPKDIHVTMAGAVGESVTISYMAGHQMAQVTCVVSEAGAVRMELLRKVCVDSV